jgi:hypothetical protein
LTGGEGHPSATGCTGVRGCTRAPPGGGAHGNVVRSWSPLSVSRLARPIPLVCVRILRGAIAPTITGTGPRHRRWPRADLAAMSGGRRRGPRCCRRRMRWTSGSRFWLDLLQRFPVAGRSLAVSVDGVLALVLRPVFRGLGGAFGSSLLRSVSRASRASRGSLMRRAWAFLVRFPGPGFRRIIPC